ncbi:MAG: FtsX-like permease family protein, partial [Bacteroidota bacterium]
ADANLFSFFSFDLIDGEPSRVLEQPMSIVLTASTSQKYFGNVNPIGRQLKIKQDSTYNFTVTGIMKDFPTNSSLNADMIVSLTSLSVMKETKALLSTDYFQNGSFATFFKVDDLDNISSIEETALKLDRLANSESNTTYQLEPFEDMHSRNTDTGRFDYLKVFPIVALLILVLALTNYISLTTARAARRAKEVGVRKISGASRKNLIVQFYIESSVFVTLAFALGVIISIALKAKFMELLQLEIANSFFLNKEFIFTLLVIWITAVVISGIYPAMVLSSFNPVKNFKLKGFENKGSVPVRKVFTVFQFSIAVILTICGIVMGSQLEYLQKKDTGLDRSNLIIMPLERTIQTNTAALRNQIEQIPGVEGTSATQYAIYDPYSIYFVSPPEQDQDFQLVTFSVDENFINTLGVSWYLKPKERKALIDNGKIIINEKTIAEYGLNPDPRGQKLSIGNQTLEIAGVVKDFHYTSLENPISPLAFFMSSEAASNKYAEVTGSAKIYIKYKDNIALPDLLDKIESTYKTYDKATPFNYEFMDDTFNAIYKSERQLASIFNVFIVLALLIAGLGLLGLITFTSQQRVKEIGIRKVLGASVAEILALLSKDFMKLVLLAILVALPIAWYFSDSWLNYFAYRINVPWWSFVLSGGIAILLSIVTLSFQGIRAAMANPVKAIRSE